MLNPSPFELRKGRFFRAYFSNIKELLLNPQGYFKSFKLFDDTFGAVLFAWLNHFLVICFGASLQLVVMGVVFYFAKGSGEFSLDDLPPELPPIIRDNIGKFMAAGIGFFYTFLLVLMPFIQVAFTFLWSGIHHLFLVVVGGTQKAFTVTLQVHLLFSFISVIGIPVTIFMMIPLVGVLVSLAYGIFVLIYLVFYYVIGIAEVHQISTGRAFLSWLAMIFVCCCLMAVPFALIMLPAMMAGMSQIPNQ